MTDANEVPSTITAAQLITFAANVNDQRVITEALALGHEAGIDEPLVSIGFEPADRTSPAQLIFTIYEMDENGERYVVHDDGTAYDPALGKPYRVAVRQLRHDFTGELPTWWGQAARVAVITPEGIPKDVS